MEPSSETAVLKNVLKEIAHFSDNQVSAVSRSSEYRATLCLKKSVVDEQRVMPVSLLSIPQFGSEDEKIDEIIHTRCQVKSRGVLNSIVNIAEKGYRTYYYQACDDQKLEETTHIINNGRVEVLTSENRERMSMLARQLKVIYDLTPVMIGYNEGVSNQKPLRILVGLLGVTVSEDNKIISYLREFEKVGVKSIITMASPVASENRHTEKDIEQEYRDRKWMNSNPNSLVEMSSIKGALGRLVCRDCLL